MYAKRRNAAMDDASRFAAWSGSERFKNGIRWVEQIDLDYKITLLEVCNARVFPRQKLSPFSGPGWVYDLRLPLHAFSVEHLGSYSASRRKTLTFCLGWPLANGRGANWISWGKPRSPHPKTACREGDSCVPTTP